MMALLLFDPLTWLGREHPAMVHLPIAAALLVPVVLLLSLWRREEGWLRTAQFLAWAGMLGSGAALLSGLLWARQLDLIAPGGWLAQAKDGHLQGLLRTHQFLALGGLVLGLLTLAVLHHKAERGVATALLLSVAWAGTWGAAGHWGGRMVFPDTAHPADMQAAHQEMQAEMNPPAPPPPDFHSVYLEMCASCHGQDGSARSPSGHKMHGQDFTDTKWQASRTDGQIVKVILDGKGHMPAFRGTLSEPEALALVQQVLRPMNKAARP